MEKQAGKIMSVFIKQYIKPAIKLVDELEIELPQKISLEWFGDTIRISNENVSYNILRKGDD